MSEKLSTYTKEKGDDSSGINVDVDINYVQTDAEFDHKSFEESAKAGIKALSSKAIGTFIKSEFDVSV